MSFLAHDQVWSADDWWTAALAPGGILLGAFLLFLVAVAATGNREGELRDAIRFGGAGFVIVGVASYAIIWAVIGICWFGGWL